MRNSSLQTGNEFEFAIKKNQINYFWRVLAIWNHCALSQKKEVGSTALSL